MEVVENYTTCLVYIMPITRYRNGRSFSESYRISWYSEGPISTQGGCDPSGRLEYVVSY